MLVRDKVALSQCHYKYSPEYLLWCDASENIQRIYQVAQEHQEHQEQAQEQVRLRC